jgi:hypothetical protein
MHTTENKIEELFCYTDSQSNEKPVYRPKRYSHSRIIDRIANCPIIKMTSHSNIKTFKQPTCRLNARLAKRSFKPMYNQ